MNSSKIKTFMQLAGQKLANKITEADSKTRELGAQLLLSETLEYVIKGLGVIPHFNGVVINEANNLQYQAKAQANKSEMIDGLADIAYTMYWNAEVFGIPLETAFELVCDNNLEKFVKLENWDRDIGILEPQDWHCNKNITWPSEVKTVQVLEINQEFYAVGKDINGKVRKPSTYKNVDLSSLV